MSAIRASGRQSRSCPETGLWEISSGEASILRAMLIGKKGGRPPTPYKLERLCEPSFEEFAQHGCCLELWDGVQFLERRSERIGKTPNGSWLEFLVLRFKVEVVHAASKVLGNFQSALDERLVDDHLGSDVRQFASLPGLHLLSHGLEVSLHPVYTHRDAVDVTGVLTS